MWDELCGRAGAFNADSNRGVEVCVLSLDEDALDFVLRLVSYWVDDVRLRGRNRSSMNLWRRPIVNLLHDDERKGSERLRVRDFSDEVPRG